jgi:HTH-like domain
VLGVSDSGYYAYRSRPLSGTALRRQWLTGLIGEIHARSRGTYGARRVRAELALGMGISVSKNTIADLMQAAGLQGIPEQKGVKYARVTVTTDDLVNRKFLRSQPNLLWVTDITEHPTREGKVYCCAVLDAFSRKIAAGPPAATRTPPWWSTPWTWPSATAAQPRAAWSTATTECNSPPGPSPAESSKPGSCPRSAPSAMAWITR